MSDLNIIDDVDEEELDTNEIRVRCCVCLEPVRLRVETPSRAEFWAQPANAKNFKCNPCSRATERKSRGRMRRARH